MCSQGVLHIESRFHVRAGSQYDANGMLLYDVMLKCWNRLDFYSSIARVMSEQLT